MRTFLLVLLASLGLARVIPGTADAADYVVGPQDLQDLSACLNEYDAAKIPVLNNGTPIPGRFRTVADDLVQVRAACSTPPCLTSPSDPGEPVYRNGRAVWSIVNPDSSYSLTFVLGCMERRGKLTYGATLPDPSRYFVNLDCTGSRPDGLEDTASCVFAQGIANHLPDAVQYSLGLSPGGVLKRAVFFTFAVLANTIVDQVAKTEGTAPISSTRKDGSPAFTDAVQTGNALGFVVGSTLEILSALANAYADNPDADRVLRLFGLEGNASAAVGGSLALTVDRLGEWYLSYAPTVSVGRGGLPLSPAINWMFISPRGDAHWTFEHAKLESWLGANTWSYCSTLLGFQACFVHSGAWFSGFNWDKFWDDIGTSYGLTAPELSVDVSWGSSFPLCRTRHDGTELEGFTCKCPLNSHWVEDLTDSTRRSDRCKCDSGVEVIEPPGTNPYKALFTNGLSCSGPPPSLPPYVSPQPLGFIPADPPAGYTDGSPNIPGGSRGWPSGGFGGGFNGLYQGDGGGGGGFGPILAPRPLSVAKGDPHITTQDRMTYTSLSLGEFVYAHGSRPDAVEVQARNTQISGFAPWASFVTAAAVRAGGHVFEARLPAVPGPALTLLLDGAPLALPRGSYTIGTVQVTVDEQNQLSVSTEEGELPANLAGQPLGWTTVRFGRQVNSELVQPNPGQPLVSLEISMSTPPLHRYAGLLGVPDGDSSNELTLPDGTRTTLVDPFVEAWRVTTPAQSLFTYAPGQGPSTYNRPQTAQPPTPAQLAGEGGGTNYVAQIEQLINSQCNQQPGATIDPTIKLQLAYDLAAGRTAADLLGSGLCFDQRLGRAGAAWANVPSVAAALQMFGRVTRTGAPTEGVPGVSLVVRSPTLGGPVCQTATNDLGYYTCVRVFNPQVGPQIQLTYELTGRGARQVVPVSVDTPAPSTSLRLANNFEVSPTSVVQLSGVVRDAGGVAVGNAPVRITSPEYRELRADAQGRYALTLFLPDGVTSGSLHVDAASPTFADSASADVPFSGAGAGVVAITRNLVLIAAQAPPPLDLTQTTVRRLAFTGSVSRSLPTGAAGVGGATVTVSAPGAIVGGDCTTTTQTDGRFSCITTLTSTTTTPTAFTATVAVKRIGSATAQVTVATSDIPLPGGFGTKAVGGILVAPTTIHAKGQVLISNVGKPGVYVVISGVGPSMPPVTTDASGNFSAELLVPDDTPPTTVLTYRAELFSPAGSNVAEATAPLGVLTVGATNERTQNIVFTRRTYLFAGTVTNTLAGGQGVVGATVQIFRNDATAAACTTTSRPSDGSYICDFTLEGDTAYTVRYVVSGVGQLELGGFPVAPAGPPTTPQLVQRNLAVTPTTVVLTGVVHNENNAPIANAQVKLGAVEHTAYYSEVVSVTTGADGRYTHAFAILNGVTTTSSPIVAQTGSAQQSVTVSTALTPNAVTTVTQDFTFFPTRVLAKKWDNGMLDTELATNGQSLALGADGTIYAMGYNTDSRRFSLVSIDPQTHVIKKSTSEILQRSLGGHSPVLGPGPNGEPLVYLTSDGNQDGTVGTNPFNRKYRGYVYAFYASDLRLYNYWAAREDQERISTSVAVGRDGVVYVATTSDTYVGTVWALPPGLPPNLGPELASATYPQGYRVDESPVIGSDGTVYVPTTDGVEAFAPFNNAPALARKWPLEAVCYSRNGINELAIGRDASGADVIYAGGRGMSGDYDYNVLCAFNPDGTRRWRLTPDRTVNDLSASSTPVIDQNGNLFVLSQDDYPSNRIRVVRIDRATGAVTTLTEVPGRYRISKPLLAEDGTLYFGADTELIGYNTRTGQLSSYLPTAGTVYEGGLGLASDGTLYTVVSATVGGQRQVRLHAINAGTVGLAPSVWPKNAGSSQNTGRSP